MEDRNTSQKATGKPIILRESEFFGGCIRVKISVKNTSSLAIMDAALELESDERILHFERCEPEYPEKKGKILLGNLDPNTDRTIALYLDPLICAKEGTNVNCRVFFKDAYGRSDMVQMEPLKIKVVCPIFCTEQDINIGRLKELVSGILFHDSRVYTIPKRVEPAQLLGTCGDVVLLHDMRHIRTFKTTDKRTYEAWYYGKTKVTKKDLVIKCCLRMDTESIEVFAAGNDPGDITGLLAEIGRNLAKEFERKVQPVFNITIKDSIIQRSNLLSFCDMDETCGGDVVIEDSVVQRANIGLGNEGGQKGTGAGNNVQIGEFSFDRKYIRKKQNDLSDFEKESGYSVAFGGEKWTKGKAMEYIETPYGFIGISKTGVERGISRKLKEALRKGVSASSYIDNRLSAKIADIYDKKAQNADEKDEIKKAIQEEDRQRRQREEAARIAREKEIALIEHKEKSSGGKWFFGVIIILVVLAMGWYGTQDSGNPQASVNPVLISTTTATASQKTTPSITATPIMTAKISASPIVTTAADQKTYTNSITMEFVLIPAGEFDMGSPSNEVGRFDYEGPVHDAKIGQAFYLGKYEVTQKHWVDVMGNNPSSNKVSDKFPVDQVSWNDVHDFIKKLNEKEGGNKYRLPTEAEWEYAARAGTMTRYSFGDDESKLGDYAWYNANSGWMIKDVGQKKPNPWGLYDMHGNVWERVQGKWQGAYNGAPTDGSSWESGNASEDHVVRGGSWGGNAGDSRSAYRYPVGGNQSDTYGIGFRLLREV